MLQKYTVVNAGRIGDTVVELAARAGETFASAAPGSMAVVMTGINDMLYPGHILPDEEFRIRHRELCRELRAGGLRVAVSTVPGIDAGKYFKAYPETPVSDPAAAIAAVNAMIRDNAVESALRVWDCAGAIGDDPALRLEDGMHLSAAGCVRAAASLARLVAVMLPEGGTTVCFGDSLFYGPWLRGRGRADADGETVPGVLNRLLNG